ncbi:hypothetical protein VTH82DRAFT_4709 [Thermothelomyces myriococcoides]
MTTSMSSTTTTAAEAKTAFTMASYMPPDATPQPAKSGGSLPPTSIQPPSELLADLPREAVCLPTALRFPAIWRCGTCTGLHSVLALLTGTMTAAAAGSAAPGCRREEEDDDDDDEKKEEGGSDSADSLCPCGRPALQAVYDQFGDLFLFWRDDPAVSDLSVPRMAEEARWRVRTAGAEGWLFGDLGGLGGCPGIGGGGPERGGFSQAALVGKS